MIHVHHHNLRSLTINSLMEDVHTSFLPSLDIPKCEVLITKTLSSVHFKPGVFSRWPTTVTSVIRRMQALAINFTFTSSTHSIIYLRRPSSFESSFQSVRLETSVLLCYDGDWTHLANFLCASVLPNTEVVVNISGTFAGDDTRGIDFLSELIQTLPGLRTVRRRSNLPLENLLADWNIRRVDAQKSKFNIQKF